MNNFNWDLLIHGLEAAAILYALLGGFFKKLANVDKIDPLQKIVERWDRVLEDHPPHRHVADTILYPKGMKPNGE